MENDGVRRGLIREVLLLLAGSSGENLYLIWLLTLALRRNKPGQGAEKRTEPAPRRRFYLVLWNVPEVVGAGD